MRGISTLKNNFETQGNANGNYARMEREVSEASRYI